LLKKQMSLLMLQMYLLQANIECCFLLDYHFIQVILKSCKVIVNYI